MPLQEQIANIKRQYQLLTQDIHHSILSVVQHPDLPHQNCIDKMGPALAALSVGRGLATKKIDQFNAAVKEDILQYFYELSFVI